MALHSSPASMLKESLAESLEAAKICITYKKTDAKWGNFMSEGCLGYPGAIILFSIIDTIGSYFRNNSSLIVRLDGKNVSIAADGWEHFKILNSKYFKQTLTTNFIKALYNKFRSSLSHNSVLGNRTIMFKNEMYGHPIHYTSKAFATSVDKNKNELYFISLEELFKICEFAVGLFMKDIDSVVPFSKQGKSFR